MPVQLDRGAHDRLRGRELVLAADVELAAVGEQQHRRAAVAADRVGAVADDEIELLPGELLAAALDRLRPRGRRRFEGEAHDDARALARAKAGHDVRIRYQLEPLEGAVPRLAGLAMRRPPVGD